MHRTSVAAVVVLFVAVLQLSARTDPTQEDCTTLQPGPDWTCANGNWYPPGYPIPAPDPSACTTIRPGEEWFCFNGNWYPPGFPVPGGTSTPPPPPPSETTCTTVQPGPDWTCFNGGWLPPGILGTCNTALSSGGGFLDSITVAGAGETVHLFVLVEPTFSCLLERNFGCELDHSGLPRVSRPSSRATATSGSPCSRTRLALSASATFWSPRRS